MTGWIVILGYHCDYAEELILGPDLVGFLGQELTIMGDKTFGEIDRSKRSLRVLYPMDLLGSLLRRLALLRAFDESLPQQSLDSALGLLPSIALSSGRVFLS